MEPPGAGEGVHRSSSSEPPSAGWYDDPSGLHRSRWWDGVRWTSRVADEADLPGRRADDRPPDRPVEPTVEEQARLRDLEPPQLATQAAPGRGTPSGDPALTDVGAGVAPDGRVRRGLVRVLATTAVLGAMFLAGIAAGWQLFDERVGYQEPAAVAAPEVVEVRIPTLVGDPAVAVMPDVRGFSEEVALEILADTVLAGEPPVLGERPWAGPAGIVVEQRPAFGVREPPGVELTLSIPATVPEVAGRSVGEVIEELEAVGATVEVERRFASGVDADQILEIEPASGSPVPATVRIVASEPSGSIALATLPLVEGRCERTERTVDAVDYGDALVCSAGPTLGQWAWLLSRLVDRVEGTVGLPDDGPTDAEVRLVFLADGVPLQSVVLSYGSAVEVSLPATDVLRLEVQAVLSDGEDADLRSVEFVLADLRLIGSADSLARLQNGS